MPKEDQQTPNTWHDSLTVFARISGWVVAPIVVSLFVGKYLDTRFDTTPMIFIATTAFAFLASCFGIYREATCYMKNFEETNGNK